MPYYYTMSVLCFVVPFVLIYLSVRAWAGRTRDAARLNALGEDDRRIIADLTALSARLEARLATLERILDAEVAGWRSREPV